jgi:hypothetical protein
MGKLREGTRRENLGLTDPLDSKFPDLLDRSRRRESSMTTLMMLITVRRLDDVSGSLIQTVI